MQNKGMSDKAALVEFAKGVNWEEHIENPVVYSSLEKIRETIGKKKLLQKKIKLKWIWLQQNVLNWS